MDIGSKQSSFAGIRPHRGILIVDPQGLGDVVCSLPLLEAVCKWSAGRWPVTVLLKDAASFELIRGNLPDISRLYMRSDEGTRGAVRLWNNLRKKVDLIIGLPEINEKKLLSLKIALGARYLVAESRPFYRRWMSNPVARDWEQSFFQAQDELANALGVVTPLPPPRITLTPAEMAWAESLFTSSGFHETGPVLGFHCGSVVPAKAWPAGNFGVVGHILRNAFPELSIISFGSADERRYSDQARLKAGVKWLDGTGEWTIRQTLALLSRCDLFISGDTGLMHMAAAVGTKTLSIFGTTSPHRRAPLRTGGLAVFPQTPCHPCYRGDWKPCTCIRLIPAEFVASLAERCLLRSSPAQTETAFGTVGVIG